MAAGILAAMDLREKLQERLNDGRPFGFCPWEDGDGTLWGILVALKDNSIVVQEIGTLGEDDGREEYELNRITYFDFGERYADRLLRLRDFVPTQREDLSFITDPTQLRYRLNELIVSQTFARVKLFPDESTSTVKVLSIEDGWVTMRDFDDLSQPYGVISHRIDNVVGLRCGTAHEEADEFVARFGER